MRLTNLILVTSCFLLPCLVGCGDSGGGAAVEPDRGIVAEFAAENPDIIAAQAEADRQAEQEEENK